MQCGPLVRTLGQPQAVGLCVRPCPNLPPLPPATRNLLPRRTPLPRTELTKKLWEYIRANMLQDPAKKTLINADEKLKTVFDGKAQVSMFEMTKLVGGHAK